MKNLLLTLILFANFNFGFSQTVGEWILVYSFKPNYETGFDLSRKKLEHNGIFVFDKDSTYTISLRNNNEVIVKQKYISTVDSLFVIEKNRTTGYKYSIDNDKLELIDAKYKGFYGVFQKLDNANISLNLKEIEKIIINSSYEMDFAKLFVIKERPSSSMIDTLTFSSGNKLTAKQNRVKMWNLIETNENVFLNIDVFLFQILKVDNNGILLRSFYEEIHDIELKKI